MSAHLGLTVARLHAVLAGRRHSDVFHIYVGPITPTGRTTRRARPVCNAHTRPLTILRRCGVVVDVHGRRMCANCSARLSAVARRAEQAPSHVDARRGFFESLGISSVDLVHALAVASSVEETHAIGNVANLLFGHAPVRRPHEDARAQGRFDFEAELIRRRDQLRAAELTPEEREARLQKRETDNARDAQILASRKKDERIARAVDRRLVGKYEAPWERDLLNTG